MPTHKSFIQSPQQYQQFQLLTPQLQQQLMLQAQSQPSGSPLLQDMDHHRRFRVLLGGRGGPNSKDGHSNPGSDVTGGGVGSPMQAASPVPRAAQDQEILMKVNVSYTSTAVLIFVHHSRGLCRGLFLIKFHIGTHSRDTLSQGVRCCF